MTVEDVERIAESWIERRGVSPEDLASVRAMTRALKHDLGRLTAEKTLNGVGKRYHAEQRLQKADSDLAPIDVGTSRVLAQLTEEEEQIVRGPVVDTSRQVEIRSWLDRLSHAEQIQQYYAAIASGDSETVAAIEGAPKALNVLDSAARQKGREMKLAQAPAETRARIEHLKHRIAARQHVVMAARRLVNELRDEWAHAELA